MARSIFGKKGLLPVLALVVTLTMLVIPVKGAIIEVGGINPVIMLEKTNMGQAVAGGEFTLTLSVRNISNNPGFELDMAFKIKDEDGLAPFSLQPDQVTRIDELAGNETVTLTYTFDVAEDAQNKNYELLASLNGKNAEFKNTVSASTIINVPISYDLTKPVLSVEDVSLTPDNPDLSDEFKVNFRVRNLSKTTDAYNVIYLLEGEDNFQVTDISNKKNVARIDKGDSQVITYSVKAKDTKVNNVVKLTASFDYQGSETDSTTETINLPLPHEDSWIGATPWVIVNKYTLSAEQVLAGNTVSLKLYIENTNQRPVKNVKISLGVIKIEDSTGNTTAGGTVFSPVNSSTSFYIESIPAKTIIEKAIDLYVDPNASAKTYIVPVEIKYEDRAGKMLECEELVNIPVTQECKFNVISTDIPKNGFVGQPINVFTEYVNVGKVALSNFMVALEGEFNKENDTYYVGNLDIGASDIFQAMIIPTEVGTLEGELVFTYIDNNNKDVRVSEPFSIEVAEMAASEMGQEGGPGVTMPGGKQVMPGQINGAGGTSVKGKLLTGFLGLIILVEGIYIWRVRRKRKSEEYFDE